MKNKSSHILFTAVIISSFFILMFFFFMTNNFGSAQAASSLSAVCWPSSASIPSGGSATWYVMPSGGTGTYTYSWSGTDTLTGTGPSVLKKYSTLGLKTASVKVTSGTMSATANCSTTVISVVVAPSSAVKSTTVTPVTSAVKATTAVMTTDQTTVGPTCGVGDETPEPCEIIAVHGINSTGEFYTAIKSLPIFGRREINYTEVPLSVTSVYDVAQSVNNKIGAIYPIYPEPDKKILVVAHSLGTISVFNYKFNNSVSYLLYDPPYDTSRGAPTFLADLPNLDWLDGPAIGGEITRAMQNGIANSPNTIVWSNGYRKHSSPGSDPIKLAHNAKQLKLHQLFDYSVYLPEDTLEVAKRKAIAAMSRTTAWIDQNCPNKDIDVTTN